MKFFVATLLCSVIGLGAAVNLQAKYPFSLVLLDSDDGYYALYWNFTRSTESIYFAVNVSTTGWVGFGLSPDGQMTGSDVIIGWVSDAGYLHDRYAERRELPPIDTKSQDWFLTNSEENNGFTLLEFTRNFTTCDPQDRDITTSTARVVWSFSRFDPTGPNGEGAQQHSAMHRGQKSLNLIGGLAGPANPPSPDSSFVDVEVSSVTIPSGDTTYWCVSRRLPSDLVSNTGYINRISPRITSPDFVHHMLVYLCNAPLSEGNVDVSQECDSLAREVNVCRNTEGLLVGAWAVGGDDFVYPEGISYPIGGSGQENYVVIEMHYDNPNNVAGTIDNSGLRFYYTNEEPEQRAGIMFLGHLVTDSMVIPPRTSNFTITGICSADCTDAYIPEEGIRIFGSLLHTHVVGRKITLQQFRPTECGVLEEIAPIDQNLNYDFNFQQFTHFSDERLVLPGDLLVLNCEYDTTANERFTLGGESTLEEMCLAFPVFYPRPRDGDALISCVSRPNLASSFNDFVDYLRVVNPEEAQNLVTTQDPVSVLNRLDWTESTELARRLQDSVQNSSVFGACGTESGQGKQMLNIEPVKNPCPYEPSDRCNPPEGNTLTCCERMAGATQTKVGVLGSIMLFLCVLMTSIF